MRIPLLPVLLGLMLSISGSMSAEPAYRVREVAGWTLHVREELLQPETSAMTEKAVEMLGRQLEEMVRVVPAKAVVQLKQVPLWFSPAYPGIQPRAEYHPGADWLRTNRRDPAMVRGVEFTNLAIFERESKRMPCFALHELAHAYHHRVLGYSHPGIQQAYRQAVESHLYDSVERWHGPDRPNTREKAYAMTNEKEYFAEATEAFFGRNDFFPFIRSELEKHDPAIVRVLKEVWGVEEKPRVDKAP